MTTRCISCRCELDDDDDDAMPVCPPCKGDSTEPELVIDRDALDAEYLTLFGAVPRSPL